MKKVSIIIPIYSAEKYVAATIQSVLEQTYQLFELLLIDDGTPDKSIEICQQFTADPRVRIIRQENRGVSAARNNGIRHARGEYIAFLDADDLWVPEKLEKHVKHLDNSPTVGVSFSYSEFIDEAGRSLGIYNATEYKTVTPASILCRNPIGNGSCIVLRSEVFAAIRFQQNLHGTTEDVYFDEEPRIQASEDAECWLRIAVQTNWKFEVIPECLTLYRLHPEGNSAKLQRKLSSWEYLLEKARTYAADVIAQWERPALAYELRYLARRAVTLEAGPTAVKLIHRALATDWKILLEEPRRTLITLAAACALCVVPRAVYSQLQSLGLKIIGYSQRRRIRSRSLQQAV
jgi:glycosyltransferase involved in cell wall biosynthesis